jgi:hypothetical protein
MRSKHSLRFISKEQRTSVALCFQCRMHATLQYITNDCLEHNETHNTTTTTTTTTTICLFMAPANLISAAE